MAINYQGGNDAVITGSFGGLMQTLQRNYMAEQQNKQDIRKQRDAILQESQKDLAKINSNGIRKADLPEFDKMYGGIKNTYYQMLTAKTPTEQRALAMQINEGLGQINSLVSQSKEVQKWENGAVDNFKNLVGQRGERDYMTHVRSGFDKPSFQLNKEYFDSSPYLNRWDEQKGNDSVQKAIQDGFKNAKNYTTLAPEVGSTYNVGERRLADVTYRDRLNPDFVLNTVSNLYQTNKDVRGQVDNMISTGQALDLNDALTKYAGIFNSDIERVSTNKGVNTEKGKGITVNVDTRGDFTDPANSIVPDYIVAIASKPINTEFGVTPQGGEVSLKNYLQFNQTQDIGGVLKGVDPETGEQVTVNGTANEAKVLGLGTDQSGRIYAHISTKDRANRVKTMLVNADKYLNTSQITKTKKAYVNELVKKGVKLQGQTNPNPNKSKTQTQTKKLQRVEY